MDFSVQQKTQAKIIKNHLELNDEQRKILNSIRSNCSMCKSNLIILDVINALNECDVCVKKF